jgi:hypothetical protein
MQIAYVGPLPINAAIGLALIGAAAPGLLPGSEYAIQLGAGLIGYPVGKWAEAKMREKK